MYRSNEYQSSFVVMAGDGDNEVVCKSILRLDYTT